MNPLLLLSVAAIAYFLLVTPVGNNSLTMYYADWCPHCKAIMPEFHRLMADFPEARAVEEKHNNEYRVQGYPTFVSNGAEYKGPRTYESWADHIHKKLRRK